jgi:hypothetical protein
MTPRGKVGGYKYLKKHTASTFRIDVYPDGGGCMFLEHAGLNPENHNMNRHCHASLKSYIHNFSFKYYLVMNI